MPKTITPKKNENFHKFLRHTAGKYFNNLFQITITPDITLTPPYILLGNHINNYDPMLIGSNTPSAVNFIASDEYFRNRFLRILLNLLGAIPKTKFLSDMSTVKKAIGVKNNNGIIGIFPEGTRSWDGKPLPIIYSTAKLVKLLKCDVAVAMIEGAMFIQPRWAKYKRRGKTFMTFKKILTTSEIESMSVEGIYKKLVSSLDYDEYRFQREHMYKYKGKKLAEHIEYFLYVCPRCKSFHTITSNGDNCMCSNCGYSIKYNEYGFFEGSDLAFDNTRDWNEFQYEETKKLVKNPFEFKANKVRMFVGRKGAKKLKSINWGTVMINNFCLEFKNLKGHYFKFNFSDITGLNIQYNRKLEFYIKDVFYRFTFTHSNISAFSIKTIITLSNNFINGG